MENLSPQAIALNFSAPKLVDIVDVYHTISRYFGVV